MITILIAIIMLVYVAAWVGTETLAEYTGYAGELTHAQMFSVPAMCVALAIALLLDREDARKSLFRKYVLLGGKISLCMWSLSEAHSLEGALGTAKEKLTEMSRRQSGKGAETR